MNEAIRPASENPPQATGLPTLLVAALVGVDWNCAMPGPFVWRKR
jgi:hypothetical protein